MNFVLVLCVLGISASFVDGQSCTLPNYDKGTCVSLNHCDVSRRIFTKKPRTAQDEQFLRDSACGFDGNIPKVCCPKTDKLSCKTPDNKPGVCMKVQDCPHLYEIYEEPIGEDEEQFLRKSVCAGPEQNSVCCGEPQSTRYGSGIEETCVPSALPPDPNSDCCGFDTSFDNKIIGGNVTGIDQYPWLVLIEYVKLGKISTMCGGSLISSKYVLTAAHCVTGSILYLATPKNVRLGEYDISHDGPDCVTSTIGSRDCTQGMVLAPIETLIPHPEYRASSFNRWHDIALIRLKNFAPRTDFIRPICLPKVDHTLAPPTNFSFYVAGWGRYIQDLEKDIKLRSKIKLHVDLPFVSNNKCQAGLRSIVKVDNVTLWNGQLCAGGVLGKDACRGDSGGPLMYEKERKYEVVGVVSYGAGICGKQDIPGVYSKVHAYLPWIRDTIKP